MEVLQDTSPVPAPRTYAEVVKKQVVKEKRVKRQSRNILQINMKTEPGNALEELKKSFSPKAAGIKIRDCSQTRKGIAVVKTNDREEMEKMIRGIEGDEELKERFVAVKA